jgi:glucokinase
MGMTAQGILVADIGGTHARFGIADAAGTVADIEVLKCGDHETLADAAKTYLAGRRAAPSGAAIAVASPITGDVISLTNRAWSFSQANLCHSLGVAWLRAVNDFEAIALGIPRLGPGDRIAIGGGTTAQDAPIAVIGPGTGLGTSMLIPTRSGPRAIAAEGGHVTMPAFDEREYEVLARLRRRIGHISAERVLSGPGLLHLYRTLTEIAGGTPEDLNSHDVTERAGGGDETCRRALDMFSAMLGTVASNLALSLGARGGVYIAGGIVPDLPIETFGPVFRARFEDKGRFSDYLAAIPCYLITHPYPAFLGLTQVQSE